MTRRTRNISMAPVSSQIATFPDEASAEACAGLLRADGIPVEVRTMSPLPGIVDEVRVYVPSSMAHRARWLVDSAKVTDEELRYAATGELYEKE